MPAGVLDELRRAAGVSESREFSRFLAGGRGVILCWKHVKRRRFTVDDRRALRLQALLEGREGGVGVAGASCTKSPVEGRGPGLFHLFIGALDPVLGSRGGQEEVNRGAAHGASCRDGRCLRSIPREAAPAGTAAAVLCCTLAVTY